MALSRALPVVASPAPRSPGLCPPSAPGCPSPRPFRPSLPTPPTPPGAVRQTPTAGANAPQARASHVVVRAAKELHFNRGGSALKQMQAGVDKLATVVGVTIGPKGRNVVLESKYGSPKIVNDGVTVAREVQLADPVENIGAKLVIQASQQTNDSAGDGTTTACVLSAALIEEGMRVVAAGANPIQIVRGIEKTVKELTKRLVGISTSVGGTDDIRNVATISAGGNADIGDLIARAMERVGKTGVVTMEESKTAEDSLYFVEGMQFDRGYVSPYFVTDPERMMADYENARLLLVDKKIATARDMVGLLEASIRGNYPLVIMAEDFEQEALATLVVNRLRGSLKLVAIKAPGFGERKSQYLDDIAILTGATVVKDETGIKLDKAGEEVLGLCARVEVSKESCVLVGDGATAEAVGARVKQLSRQLEITEADYEKEKLNERIARLSGGVAIVQVGGQTETELKEKKLRVEDALCATRAAVEEGIVVGGGCTFLKLSAMVEDIKPTLANEEQRVGADIVKRALRSITRLVANNAGVNGSVVINKVTQSEDPNFGFNAENGTYCDLMAAGVVDPTKVIRCSLENAASVAKTFLTASVVITEIPADTPEAQGAGGMGGY